jgi:GAF domain-containing protein
MDEAVAQEFANLAIELQDHRTLSEAVDQVVEFAITAVGCDSANLLFVHEGGRIQAMASTGTTAERIAQIVVEVGEGPALDLPAEPGSQIVVHDANAETRWPRWSRELVSLGVHSALCTRLATNASPIGALNLYASEPLAFSSNDVAAAHILAQHASVALAASRQQYVFAQEIDARKWIGRAQGILMERFGLNPDQAFELLRRYAKKHRMKLIETAQELVTGRELPRVTDAGR